MSDSRNRNVQIADDSLDSSLERGSKQNIEDSLEGLKKNGREIEVLKANALSSNKVSDFKVDLVCIEEYSSSGDVADLKIRDFAFRHTDPRHWGEQGEDVDIGSQGLSKAMALFDFEAENPSEISFMQDDILTIQHKQCAGWLVGFKEEEKVGLIPESFVRFID